MSNASLEWTRSASVTPLAASMADTALALDVMAGFSAEDPYSISTEPGSFSNAIRQSPPTKLRVGVNRSFGVVCCESDVLSGLDRVLDALRDAGHDVIEDDTSLPDVGRYREQIARRQAVNGLSALTSYLLDYESDPAGFDPDYVAPLNAAYRLKTADFYEYWQHRELQDRWSHRLFSKFDIYVTPTVAVEAPPIESPNLSTLHEWLVFTSIFNDTGLPALSVPAGLSGSGMPVAVQIAAPMHQESLLLQIGRMIEEALPWPRCPQE